MLLMTYSIEVTQPTLFLSLDRLGDGDWRFGTEGKPALFANTVSQDHPGRMFGSAEEAGVFGLGR